MGKEKMVKSGLWQLLNVGSFVIIQLLFIGLLSRYVSKTQWGYIAIANAIIQLALIIAEGGLGPALVYRKEVSKGHLSATTFFNFVIALFFALLFFFLSTPIANFYGDINLKWIVATTGLNFLVRAVGLTSMYMLQKNMKFKQLCIIEVSSNFISSAAGVYWAMIGWGAWAYLWSYVLMAIINSIGYMYFNRKNLVFMTKFTKVHVRDLFSYGVGQTLNRLVNGYFNNNAGVNFVVAKLIPLSSTGIFDRIYRVMMLPSRYFGNVIDRVMFAGMSKLNEDKEQMYAVFEKTLKTINIIIFSMSLIFIIYSNEIVLMLFGKKWLSDALIPLRILFAAIPFKISQRIVGSILRSQGLVYKSAWIGFLNAIYLIALVIIGSYWGIVGVTVAIVASSMINYFNMLILIKKTYNKGYDLFYKQFIDVLPILLAICAIVYPFYFVAGYFKINQFFPMIASLAFLIFIFLFLLKKKQDWIDPLIIRLLNKLPLVPKLIKLKQINKPVLKNK